MSDEVTVSDLAAADVVFLRSVRDINANPDQFENTSAGRTAANKTAIAKATDLSESQVDYRFGANGSKGFTQDEAGLIKVYEPELSDGDGFNIEPRSAELTQKGREFLSDVEEQGFGAKPLASDEEVAEDSETIKQLRSRIEALEGEGEDVDTDSLAGIRSELTGLREAVERLEAEIESLGDRVNAVEQTQKEIIESEWGAVNDDHVSDLSKMMERTPAMYYALKIVLGVDVDEIVESGGVPNGEMDTVRAEVREALGMDSVDESVEDEGEDGDDGGRQPPSAIRDRE